MNDVGGNLNTQRFSYVDPLLTHTSFFETAGAFPWNFDEPSDAGNAIL